MAFSRWPLVFVILFIFPDAVVVISQLQPSRCKLSEFECSNRRCIAWDRYCDGVNHCQDSSDEPRHCTRCNRTYYGEIDRTYLLELHRPREDRLPFVCKITFLASGGEFGDIVQVTFGGFAVGRLIQSPTDSCPDGHLHISEPNRPDAGGLWCGAAWGRSVYFSDTNGVTLTLVVLHLPSEQQAGYNFEFRLAYRFLPQRAAMVRYGDPDRPYFRGTLLPGTYCSLIFDNCKLRPCRLQSPNFPGLYPRNTTCYYAIRQHVVPTQQHAMIRIAQEEPHLISVFNQASRPTSESPSLLRVGDQCPETRDHVTIYDGYTVRDPVLLRFCGTGPIPQVVSSKNEVLVEFVSSPVDSFPPASLDHVVSGFQLDVDVQLVDRHSYSYVEDGKCEFYISPSTYGKRRGVLRNPQHTLAPNASCTYYFKGNPGDLVWIAVLKFYVSNAIAGLPSEEECATRLEIWDGGDLDDRTSLLGRLCNNSGPKSCDHVMMPHDNSSRSTKQAQQDRRACMPSESYISSGPGMTIKMQTRLSTALRPVQFQFLYEFVDVVQDGQVIPEGHPCDRVFRSDGILGTGKFESPQNVFLYGRGGRTNLTCVIRFQAQPNERVKITLNSLQIRSTLCDNVWHPHLSRYQCWREDALEPTATLTILELPWNDTRVPRECFCSNASTTFPLNYVATAPVVELSWKLIHMSPLDDHVGNQFEGQYEFLPTLECNRNQRLSGPSGEIRLRRPSRSEEVNCEHQPWIVVPTGDRFVYISARGHPVIRGKLGRPCSTRNRIAIYSGGHDSKLLMVFCPDTRSDKYVEVFSVGWNESLYSEQKSDLDRSLVVDFIAKERGTYTLRWLELSKGPIDEPVNAHQVMPSETQQEAPSWGQPCEHRCPELGACISASLWCDGRDHCPSGYDELEMHCSPFFIPMIYIYGGAGILGLLVASTFLACCCSCKQRDRGSCRSRATSGSREKMVRRTTTDEIFFGSKDPGC